MENSDKICDCRCNGNNPNCSACDGKGYYYLSDNCNKPITKTEAEGHILNLNSMWVPKGVTKPVSENKPVLKKRKKKPAQNLYQKPYQKPDQNHKIKSSYKPKRKSEITKNKAKPINPPGQEKNNNVIRPPRNLVQSFPEIEEFFIFNMFSQDKLEELLIDLKIRYKDKNLYSAALGLVKLELLKLEIGKEDDKHKAGLDKPKRVAKEMNRPKNKLGPEVPRDISRLSSYLRISERSLIEYLKQRSIYKEETDVLDVSELSAITPYILARLNALRRQNKRSIW